MPILRGLLCPFSRPRNAKRPPVRAASAFSFSSLPAFGENLLSPGLTGLSPAATGHPLIYQCRFFLITAAGVETPHSILPSESGLRRSYRAFCAPVSRPGTQKGRPSGRSKPSYRLFSPRISTRFSLLLHQELRLRTVRYHLRPGCADLTGPSAPLFVARNAKRPPVRVQ